MKATKLLPILAVVLCVPGIALRALHLLNGFDVSTGLPTAGEDVYKRQAEQQVLRANVAVAERSGRFLCKRQCLTGTLGKTVLIEHK